MKARTDLADWDGQSQPTPKHQLGKPVIVDTDGGALPNFGHFEEKRRSLLAKSIGTDEVRFCCLVTDMTITLTDCCLYRSPFVLWMLDR